MTKLDLPAVWRDIKTYRRAYTLTAVASFGGMLFGWDTGLIGVCTIARKTKTFD
jgi:SP family sugar:H+ symporter-like MFS transporter